MRDLYFEQNFSFTDTNSKAFYSMKASFWGLFRANLVGNLIFRELKFSGLILYFRTMFEFICIFAFKLSMVIFVGFLAVHFGVSDNCKFWPLWGKREWQTEGGEGEKYGAREKERRGES